ncbi:hypothetical protein FN846DRAFT_926303 [Sphaerosporella brunnea]|uniref:UBC core domain-containing protein n=1 Tax=Sphaerosporella brunnea TaxID=1250544 RepID=A0A5J5FAF2_9PEZI|nr:hypothetical protein FN846DRAFT_926303 [Sphaerosporella brunnea]
MPRRHFVSDLERLSTPGALGPFISDLKRGDDDGSFLFTFNPHRYGVKSVEVAGTVPELSDYPKDHLLFLYTTSSDAPTYASRALEGLELGSANLEKAILKVTETFQRALAAEDADEYGDEYDYEALDDEDDGSFTGWEDEVLNTHGSDNSMLNDLGPNTDEKKKRLSRDLRNDLKQARAAGFKVGVLGDYKGGMNFFVSLGIRFGKLGISEEAATAWKLDKAKYLILVIHYSNYYQTIARLAGENGGYHARKGIIMCVGTGSRYKPTLREAIAAFTTVNNEVQGAQNNGALDPLELGSDAPRELRDGDFESIFISGPLNQLLNTHLVPVVKYRMHYGFGWDGAELYFNANQGKECSGSEAISDKYYEEQPSKHNITLKPIVMADALADAASSSSVSFPLVAMQFTLRHLVRCTEFCLVCHNKVSTDFEALKPYVCSSPLCLYQYMSLGFGPSIEYEIVSQPAVVDLLVSFCYTAAKAGRLETFPDGMDLKVPSTTVYKANFHRYKSELQFDDETGPSLKEGDWIVITIEGNSSDEWCARIAETGSWPTVKVAQPINTRIVVGPQPSIILPNPSKSSVSSEETVDTSMIPGVTDIRPVQFRICDDSFDALAIPCKRTSIVNMLNTLPPVSEMKAWLQKNTNPGDELSLRKWRNRISPSAVGLLRWVIASNRSCIVPLEDSEDAAKSGFLPVQGMSSEWKQFRFVMGAPDKEQRFVNSVNDAKKRLNLKYPTLFAFHGSPLANWHSIIREGLHFKQTLHGRAFGHGCYHSLDLSTSTGYSNSHPHGQGVVTWPQSELKIHTALSLNEIVNAPSEFVSRSPHLVVAQLDWIQTRYLFVQVFKQQDHNSDSTTPLTPPTASKTVVSATFKLDPSRIHPQDPSYTPRGGSGSFLVIPATPTTRKRLGVTPDGDIEMLDAPPLDQYLPKVTGKKKKKQKLGGSGISSTVTNLFAAVVGSFDDVASDDWEDASVTTDVEDLLALLSDQEEAPPVIESKAKAKAVPNKPSRPDEFIPGSLDISNITFLAPPSYASSMASKRLNSDLQSIIKLQKTQPLDELGFYINPDLVDNVYQWIVEMHSFPEHLPLVKDMRSKSPVVRSIVFEIRFGPQYPMTPPFVRVVKPRFLGFNQGGGGNVTLGGAMCMELLTNSGWSAVSTVESVLMQVRMALMDEERAARLERGAVGSYGVGEAVEAFKRACRTHGWAEPEGMDVFLGQT